MASKSKHHGSKMVNLGRLGHPSEYLSFSLGFSNQHPGTHLGSLAPYPRDLHLPEPSPSGKMVVESASSTSKVPVKVRFAYRQGI